MSTYLNIHPENPQPRLIRQAVEVIRRDGLIVYPTDSSYALGCRVGDKRGLDRIREIRALDKKHNFTLVCRDLSEIATYAKVDNSAYRLMKSLTPGPFTVILRATHEVPRRLQNPKRKTIGLRVPAHPIALALLECLGEPLMSSTLMFPGKEIPENDLYDVRERINPLVDVIIDGDQCGVEPTTVIDLVDGAARILRQGCGIVEGLDG